MLKRQTNPVTFFMIPNLGFFNLSAFKLGVMASISTMIIGQRIYQEIGLISALFSIFIGCCVLFCLSILQAQISIQSRLSFDQMKEAYLPIMGSKIISLFIAVVVSFWFGLQLRILGYLFAYATGVDSILFPLFCAMFIVFMVSHDVSIIGPFAQFSIMIIVLAMIWLVVSFLLKQNIGSIRVYQLIHIDSIMQIISYGLISVALIPNYYRFAKDINKSIWSLFVTYVIGCVVVALSGAAVMSANPSANMVISIMTLEDSTIWSVFAFIVILLLGITTNNGNLYSASISINYFYPKIDMKFGSVCMGLLGFGFYLVDPFQYLVLLLQIVGIVMIGIFAIIGTEFLLDGMTIRPSNKWKKFLNLLSLCGANLLAYWLYGQFEQISQSLWILFCVPIMQIAIRLLQTPINSLWVRVSRRA